MEIVLIIYSAYVLIATAKVSDALAPESVSRGFLDAIRCVESNGDVCAIGDNGRSLGAYQIMRDYYNDAVEFSGDLRATGKDYEDVWGEGSVAYSESVIRAYMCRYATERRLGRNATLEDMARIHNGGPNGYTRASTEGYWRKVSNALNTRWTDTVNSGKCAPRCKQGQCCQEDDQKNYRCFCLQEYADRPGRYISRPCENCSIAGVDLMFILDSSGSIGASNFQIIRSFVNTFVSILEIGPTRSQIGVIVFSSSAHVQFSLGTHSDRSSLTSAVNSIQYRGGGTNTAAALSLLINQGFANARPVNEGIPRVAIVVTDGKSNSREATIDAAGVLRQNKLITTYAVGIDNADLSELNAIASTRNLVRFISSFDSSEIDRLQGDLNEQACTASTSVEVESVAVSRSIQRNTKVYLQYDVPSEGFTVKTTVDEGAVAVCGSRSLERPDCSYAPTHDWTSEVESYSEIYINGNGLPNDNLQSISKRQTTVITNITVYITIEGLASQSTFSLNTTYGDTTTPNADDKGTSSNVAIISGVIAVGVIVSAVILGIVVICSVVFHKRRKPTYI